MKKIKDFLFESLSQSLSGKTYSLETHRQNEAMKNLLLRQNEFNLLL